MKNVWTVRGSFRVVVGLFVLSAGCNGSPGRSDAGATMDAGSAAALDAGPAIPFRAGEDGGCNGLVSSCTRTYDQVTIAATHNAYSYASGGPVHYLFPNQNLPIPDQLNAGIRGLGIRPCPYGGTDPSQADVVYVTHNYARLHGSLGEEPLAGVLTRIRDFLAAHPREVVTLYMESDVTPDKVAAVFDEVGLTSMLFTLDPTAGWPTLQEMIDAGERLVAFNDSQDPSRPAWMLYLWDEIVDTDYNITDPSQFSCAFYRGTAGNPIYYLNEFVYRDVGSGVVVPDEDQAAVVNAADFVVARANRCLGDVGRTASVVYVDFFADGDVVSAVDMINRAAAGP